MNRKQFILAQGATCRNWTWSWAFVNKAEKVVIFGAWDTATSGSRAMILNRDWQTSRTGRKSSAFGEAREYLRRVEEDGYRLFTFPMKFSSILQDANGVGPARIGAFVPELTEKVLMRVGDRWYASDGAFVAEISEEVQRPELYWEGASKTVSVNAYERSRAARAACLAHHGRRCAVCAFEGKAVYGEVGNGVIHVHHIVAIADIKREYELDPIRDLVPICPNCHAVIHSTQPALTVAALRQLISHTHVA